MVYVAAKLIEVDAGDVHDELVRNVSRYANSQNRISEADFSANDPFHVRLEELSRTTWAPPVGGSQRQTRWFYERARGQYQDARASQTTPARRRTFLAEHPTRQRFTKTDLAKFENTWGQLPHVVSRGAQKNFSDYMIRRGGTRPDGRRTSALRTVGGQGNSVPNNRGHSAAAELWWIQGQHRHLHDRPALECHKSANRPRQDLERGRP